MALAVTWLVTQVNESTVMPQDTKLTKLTLQQVAKLVGVHHATVCRWVTEGVRNNKLSSFLIGGRRYVATEALECFLADGTEPSVPDANPESHWDEHTIYPVADWQHEVAEDSTRLGYREWVEHQIELNEDDTTDYPFQISGASTGRWKGGEKSNITEVPRTLKKAESD